MTDNGKLLPCPRCGGVAHKSDIIIFDDNKACLECRYCGYRGMLISIPSFDSKEMWRIIVYKSWNTRSIEAAKALLEAEGYFVGKWEPITKAPKKKGKFFWGIDKYNNRFVFQRGAFLNNKTGKDVPCWADANHEYDVKPTYFMELPQPQKED